MTKYLRTIRIEFICFICWITIVLIAYGFVVWKTNVENHHLEVEMLTLRDYIQKQDAHRTQWEIIVQRNQQIMLDAINLHNASIHGFKQFELTK